jgi:hypothetical protein
MAQAEAKGPDLKISGPAIAGLSGNMQFPKPATPKWMTGVKVAGNS